MKRIIVYGYGKTYHKLKEIISRCEVVAIADQKAEEMAVDCKTSEEMPLLISPGGITSFEYDYVAISPPGYYEQIKQQLVSENGVPEEKIISLQMFVEDAEDNTDKEVQSLKDLLKEKECIDNGVKKYTICPEKEPQGKRFTTANGMYFVTDWKDNTNINAKMYMVQHKDYNPFCDNLYTPITVGNYRKDGYLWEGQGENISYLNNKINECTALYWIWKNSDADIVGLNHYHRYFYNNDLRCRENRLDGDTIERVLNDYDLIVYQGDVPRGETVEEELRGDLPDVVYEYGYRLIRDGMMKYQSEYLTDFEEVWKEKKCCYCNMFVARKKILDSYCEWLFSFLIPVAEQADVSGYDAHDSRVIGFFAERMLSVWLHHNQLKVKSLLVFVP